jgi:hypothetical protein
MGETRAAISSTIHQNGAEVVSARIDDAAAAQVEERFTARIKAQQPQAGSETALRKYLIVGGLRISGLRLRLAPPARLGFPSPALRAMLLRNARQELFRYPRHDVVLGVDHFRNIKIHPGAKHVGHLGAV